MSCGGGQSDFSWENVIPPWQQAVAEPFAALLESEVGKAATPLPEDWPLAPQQDPLQLAAAQMMMDIGGFGEYKPPDWMSMSDYGSGPGPAFAGASGPAAAPAAQLGPWPSGPLPASLAIGGPASMAGPVPFFGPPAAVAGVNPVGPAPYLHTPVGPSMPTFWSPITGVPFGQMFGAPGPVPSAYAIGPGILPG